MEEALAKHETVDDAMDEIRKLHVDSHNSGGDSEDRSIDRQTLISDAPLPRFELRWAGTKKDRRK